MKINVILYAFVVLDFELFCDIFDYKAIAFNCIQLHEHFCFEFDDDFDVEFDGLLTSPSYLDSELMGLILI